MVSSHSIKQTSGNHSSHKNIPDGSDKDTDFVNRNLEEKSQAVQYTEIQAKFRNIHYTGLLF